jgi:hypothetical protein
VAVIPEVVPVICMAVGHRYPDVYIAKLESMLRRQMPVPFRLTCIVDRPRRLPPTVELLDASAWGMRREGMRVTTDKVRLFDAEAMPYPEFLYFDTTLVIQRDLSPLLEFAFGSDRELVVVKDWNYDCYNTCVMRIRTGGDLGVVCREFVEGKTYPRRNPGDQDFVHASIGANGLADRVELFPTDYVVSYRNARALNRTDPAAALAYLEKGIIVKLFGKPKMHQLLNPFYRFFSIRLADRQNGRADSEFWVRELRDRWR